MFTSKSDSDNKLDALFGIWKSFDIINDKRCSNLIINDIVTSCIQGIGSDLFLTIFMKGLRSNFQLLTARQLKFISGKIKSIVNVLSNSKANHNLAIAKSNPQQANVRFLPVSNRIFVYNNNNHTYNNGTPTPVVNPLLRRRFVPAQPQRKKVAFADQVRDVQLQLQLPPPLLNSSSDTNSDNYDQSDVGIRLTNIEQCLKTLITDQSQTQMPLYGNGNGNGNSRKNKYNKPRHTWPQSKMQKSISFSDLSDVSMATSVSGNINSNSKKKKKKSVKANNIKRAKSVHECKLKYKRDSKSKSKPRRKREPTYNQAGTAQLHTYAKRKSSPYPFDLKVNSNSFSDLKPKRSKSKPRLKTKKQKSKSKSKLKLKYESKTKPRKSKSKSKSKPQPTKLPRQYDLNSNISITSSSIEEDKNRLYGSKFNCFNNASQKQNLPPIISSPINCRSASAKIMNDDNHILTLQNNSSNHTNLDSDSDSDSEHKSSSSGSPTFSLSASPKLSTSESYNHCVTMTENGENSKQFYAVNPLSKMLSPPSSMCSVGNRSMSNMTEITENTDGYDLKNYLRCRPVPGIDSADLESEIWTEGSSSASATENVLGFSFENDNDDWLED